MYFIMQIDVKKCKKDAYWKYKRPDCCFNKASIDYIVYYKGVSIPPVVTV